MSYRSPGYSTLLSREGWLNEVANGRLKPKPPAWWLDYQQENEGRTWQTSSIIWGRNYSAARKMTVWSQAPVSDFVDLGYYMEAN